MILPTSLENACLSLVLGSLLSEFISFVYLVTLYKIDKKRYKQNHSRKKTYYKDITKISFPIPIRLEKSGIPCETALSQYGMITGMVMNLIWFPCLFINVFAGLLIPEYSRLNALDNSKRINVITNKIFKITMLFSVLIFGIFFTFAD